MLSFLDIGDVPQCVYFVLISCVRLKKKKKKKKKDLDHEKLNHNVKHAG